MQVSTIDIGYSGSQKPLNSRLKGIMFCEFHPTEGPKITYQVPDECVSKEVFDAVSVYIIPKQPLHHTVITVNALGFKIVGYPVSIVDPKYKRNSFIFNVCFVFDDAARTGHYEQVVRKLAKKYLVSLEFENQFLTQPGTREQLPRIMAQVLKDLNESGQCTIPINVSNTMYLRVVQQRPTPSKVEDHYVPIFVIRTDELHASLCDLTTQQILSYIDGVRHVARIAAETDVEIGLVKQCIECLVYYGVTKIVPIFQYSNVYRVTPRIQVLAENASLQEECIAYVARADKPKPHFRDVFMLYCGMAPGTTVRDLCIRYNPHSLNVDEIKLVQFGIVKEIIHRLGKYPVHLNNGNNGNGKQNSLNLTKMFNGLNSYDEICCKTGMSYQELDEKVESDPQVVVCWK